MVPDGTDYPEDPVTDEESVDTDPRVVAVTQGGALPKVDLDDGFIPSPVVVSADQVVSQPDPAADLTADARNRALRTFLNGLSFDVILAVVVYLGPVIFSWQSFDDIQWQVIVFSLTKTILVTVISYIRRKFLDKTGLPTAQPPVVSGDLLNPALTGNK